MAKHPGAWQRSTLTRSFNVLSRRDRRKIAAIAILQVCMGALDLLGVLAIGLLGALSVTGIQSREPSDRVNSILKFLQFDTFTFQEQVLALGFCAVLLLVGRTVLSIFFTRRILFFLSRRGAKISANLIARLLAQPLLTIQMKTTQEMLYALTRGVEIIVLQVLAMTVVLVSDISLLLVMSIGLFIVDPTTALGTLVVFILIGYLLFRFMHVRAGSLGLQSSELNIQSNEKIVEVFSSYRESVVRNRRDFYAREIGKLRFLLSDVSAEASFMPYVSKYVIETTVILGAVCIGGIQFLLQDVAQAVSTLAIFLAAGSRIAPAVLRVQQSSVSIRGSIGAALPTLDLIDSLGNLPILENVDDSLHLTHTGFDSTVKMTSVSFTYPKATKPAIYEISLTIPAGSSIAIVGPSGAGKTTFIDVLLGVIDPDEGCILISGVSPRLAVTKWPGAMSYVPQDVVITSGTIRENVALGYPPEAVTDDLIISALKVAHLDEFVMNLPNGLSTQVGERGAKISGGQRQRLGIARAMFTRPNLLVLDEATSSLDGQTEAIISDALHALRGSTTVVLIAHRLSTVRNADIVVYLSEGKIMAAGSFNEVRQAVPDFDHQANLMGL